MFDGILSPKALEALHILLKAGVREKKENPINLKGFAITNSSYLKGEKPFQPLFNMLGGEQLSSSASGEDTSELPSPAPQLPPSPMLPLTWLDLSGNGLGDARCAVMLDIALMSPMCILQALNLSRNGVGKGQAVAKSFEKYIAMQKDAAAGKSSTSPSTLKTLYLDSNGLRKTVVTAIMNSIDATSKGLNLHTLSLADNGLTEAKDLKQTIRSLLSRQTFLTELNLSKNAFGEEGLNHILFGLLENADPTLCILKLNDNSPPLTVRQQDELAGALMKSRSARINDWLIESGFGCNIPQAEVNPDVPVAKLVQPEKLKRASTSATTPLPGKDAGVPGAKSGSIGSQQDAAGDKSGSAADRRKFYRRSKSAPMGMSSAVTEVTDESADFFAGKYGGGDKVNDPKIKKLQWEKKADDAKADDLEGEFELLLFVVFLFFCSSSASSSFLSPLALVLLFTPKPPTRPHFPPRRRYTHGQLKFPDGLVLCASGNHGQE